MRERFLFKIKSLWKRLRGDSNFDSVTENFHYLRARVEYLERMVRLPLQAENIPKASGDLRLHQMASVALLKRFTDFLDAHSIHYWLDFGTLLGAIRHGGFVPWDDDLDISMTRSDYERLRQVIHEWKTDVQWYFYFNWLQIYYGNTRLNLDIFPYFQGDCVEVKEENCLEKSCKLDAFFYYPTMPIMPRPDERGRMKMDAVPENWDAQSIVFFNEEFLQHQAPLPNGYLVLPLWRENNGKRFFIPFEKIFPLQQLNFEGLNFYAPNSPDFILRGRYGDYLNLPNHAKGFWAHSAINHEQAQELKMLAKELNIWNKSEQCLLQ